MDKNDLIKYIDYTSLNFTDSKASILKFIEKAKSFNVSPAAICIDAYYAQELVDDLKGTNINSCVVACEFPNGKMRSVLKFNEVKDLVELGVNEIDIVLPFDAQCDQDYYVSEIAQIKRLMPDTILKVIIESGMLNEKEIELACDICLTAGADFIKTSTGKNGQGATLEAVSTICEKIEEHFQRTNTKVGIKISGGVRNFEDANMYIGLVRDALGDNWISPNTFRIGASSLIENLIND